MAETNEEEAAEIVRQYNEGKQNVHSFFTKIIQSDDTTKTGNLTQDELGYPRLPVRTYKELQLFCDDVASEESWANYFKKMSEIQTSTSLSKDALLIKLSVTNKKEIADITPEKKANKGWFKKKDDNQQTQTS